MGCGVWEVSRLWVGVQMHVLGGRVAKVGFGVWGLGFGIWARVGGFGLGLECRDLI